jgi:hypothetical protein
MDDVDDFITDQKGISVLKNIFIEQNKNSKS